MPVLDDLAIKDPSTVERVVLLSGKAYYDLIKERAALEVSDKVAFVRIEELSPFPYKLLADVVNRYSNAQEWYWFQEEPRNQGAWPHVAPRLYEVQANAGRDLKARGIKFVGRKEDSVPAVGVTKTFKAQQVLITRDVFARLQL